jgi:hypothetical protein
MAAAGCGRTASADHDVANALFKFADVARPVVVGGHAGSDAAKNFGGQRLFLFRADAF